MKTDSASKAKILSTHFQQVFTQEDLLSMPHKACSEIPSIDSVVFNRAGVEHLLKNLDSKKANRPNCIPQDSTFLFNQSYDSSELPEDWRNTHVVPISEKGAKHHPSNYRPVWLESREQRCQGLNHGSQRDHSAL